MKLQNLWLLHNFTKSLLISKPSQIVVIIKINAYGLLKFALELKIFSPEKNYISKSHLWGVMFQNYQPNLSVSKLVFFNIKML